MNQEIFDDKNQKVNKYYFSDGCEESTIMADFNQCLTQK